jgi:hypothetical protein
MRFGNRSRRALPVVANHAAKLIQRVWQRRMRPERLIALIGKTLFLQRYMACGTAIRDLSFRNPDLLDTTLKVSSQARRVRPLPD